MRLKNLKRNILLTPGPVTTTNLVKNAQIVPDICPREAEFSRIMRGIRQDLVKIVDGDKEYTSILFCGSGTSVMEASISSVVPPGKKIVIVNNGAYGERLVKIAHAYGITCVELSFAWGESPDLEKIRAALEKDKDITSLAMVHHETTTGMLNPIKKIAHIAKNNNCTVIVDTISSFAGIPINIKDYKIDFMFSVSNKCIQGMPGLAFVICNKDELEKIKDFPERSFYLNLYQQYAYFRDKYQMRFTPPVQVIYALKQALSELFLEGIDVRYKRYSDNWRVLRYGLAKRGFKFLLDDKKDAHLLLSVLEPDVPNYEFGRMHDLLSERGFTIYPGKLKDEKTFRLATIGAIDKKDIANFLSALDEVLEEMGCIIFKNAHK